MQIEHGEVTLISTTYEQDDIGQPVATETERTIMCEINSIGRSEWIAAEQRDMESAIMLRVFSAEYNGEKIAKFCGKRYEVYRIYKIGEATEIYLGTRVGDLNA